MDNLAYLNQISQKNKPKKSSLFSDKKFKIIGIALGAITFIIILLVILTNLPAQETDYVPRLAIRANVFNNIINDYQSSVKSPDLREKSASLSGILSSMVSTLPSYYTNPKDPTPNFVNTEEAATDYAVRTSLEKGKGNGLLDRAYARQGTYYINLILSLIDEINESTNNAPLKEFLTSKKSEIEIITPAFSDFSDAK